MSILPLNERIGQAPNPTGKKLLQLMHEKQTNLCVAADVTHCEELIKLAEGVGNEICLFKTHIDILEDFSFAVIEELKKIAHHYQFLLFEDRKFADIGNTVLQQYEKGIYRIVEWADIVNAHVLPGPGIIEGLKKVGLPRERGLLLLAEMSSSGSLAVGTYTEKAIEWAISHADFVMGFICQRKLSPFPGFIHMTPGIQFADKADFLGQQYNTPESAIAKGSDVLIVGRGIYAAKNPRDSASLYKKAGWQAYTGSKKI
jgi:orotidine 5'-phosphate decarboxylase subfamily 1